MKNNTTKLKSGAAKWDVTLTHVVKKEDQFKEQSLSEEYVLSSSTQIFTSEMEERKFQKEKQICTVQYHQ